MKRKRNDESSDEEQETPDEVRLWENGFKERYYESKFDVDRTNSDFRHNVALEYVRGLCWVLQYYYQGCPSWKWYFPYHYAPFASDFVNVSSVSTKFEKNTVPVCFFYNLLIVNAFNNFLLFSVSSIRTTHECFSCSQ